MKNTRILLPAALLVALVLTGCTFLAPDPDPLSPPVVDPGSADFSTYVALGNSLTAGYQSGALYASTQVYGWSALLASAMDTDYALPLIADPGIYNAALGLGHLQVVFGDDGSSGLAPIPWSGGIPPAFLNGAHPGPYNDLGVPGALSSDLLVATSAATSAAGNNSYFDIILRNAQIDWTLLGGASADLTALGQAILMEPSFLSLWIGNNEILGRATAGAGGAIFTPEAFGGYYRTIVASLLGSLPDLDMVVANIPSVVSTPYFTTIPWFVVDSNRQPVDGDPATAGVQLVGLIAADAGPGQLASGDLVLLPLLSYDGNSSGVPDLNEGLGIPDAILIGGIMAGGASQAEAIALLPTLFPLHGMPIPGALTLIGTEFALTQAATVAYNDSIAAIAAEFGFPVVDTYSLLAEGAAEGLAYNEVVYTTEFVTGGLFSLDGVHPSNVGYAIIAAEFIRVINDFYGSDLSAPSLPEVPVREMPPSRITFLPEGFPNLP